ncbi:cystathionine beta-lyase [Planctomycetales bacterium]|nr:cystathionine beta-lyase [Planctomycetales bacterium]
MLYDFDEIIDRRGTNSLKYDFAAERGMPADVLPLWVADMDFRAPREVLDALRDAAAHGIFGYSDDGGGGGEAARAWFRREFAYDPQPEWTVKSPGVVFALATAVRAFTAPNDATLIQEPVYYPFSGVVTANGRRVVSSPLVIDADGRHHIDFDDFERQIVANDVKLFLLCSPHNPVGRVWTLAELQQIGDICRRHRVVVVADEIHCDFVWDENRHRVFSTVADFADFTVVCTAPSKTFNLAGLQTSNIFIADAGLRRRFQQALRVSGYSQLNQLGLVATESAYRHGRDWLTQLRKYLVANRDFMRDFLRRELPVVKMTPLEGTYLTWVDCRPLGFSHRELNDRIIQRGKLWLDDGLIFGKSGAGFQRFNIACPRATLAEALNRFAGALAKDN